MGLTGKTPDHPSPFTTRSVAGKASIAHVIEAMIAAAPPEMLVFDPYAGQGIVLEGICEHLGRAVDGIDIEAGADGYGYRNTRPWVRQGNAADPACYPSEPFVVATSPPYTNRVSIDYRSGPTPATKLNGRRSYGTSLGRPLHPDNIARLVDRNGSDAFFAELGEVFKLWGHHAILNVDFPMGDRCLELLSNAGFDTYLIVDVTTPRARGFANSDIDDRPDHEIVIAAGRPG